MACAAQQRQVFAEGLVAHRVFDEVGREVLDQIAAANGVGEVEALVEVDAPIAVLADAFAGLGALFGQFVEALVGIVGPVGRRVGGAGAVAAKAGFHGGARAFLHAHAGANAGDDAAGGIALAVVARHAAQQGVDRAAEHLAFDIPQREVEGADRVDFLASRRIEEGARHVLPEALDVLRVLADEASGGLLEGVARAAFADAGDAGVGFDGDDEVALVEERIGAFRRVHADARDLHLGDGGVCDLAPGRRQSRGGDRGFQKCPTIHANQYIAFERTQPADLARVTSARGFVVPDQVFDILQLLAQQIEFARQIPGSPIRRGG